MKNIKIIVLYKGKLKIEYLSDIIPNVGDMIEISEEKTNEEKYLYHLVVSKRIFIPNNNKVKIIVEDNLL